MFFIPRLFSPVLLAAALAGPALAQTTPADSARTYAARTFKHQLGLTVSPQFDNLFTTNRVLPVGLLYKQQVRPGRAWRVRLTGYYSRRDTATAGGSRYLPDASKGPDARVWEVNALVGYEWQHWLGHRWQINYGLEAGPGYHNEYRPFNVPYYYPSGAGGPYTYTETGSRYLYYWQLQSRGFAGLSYALTSKIQLFAETAIALSYRHQKSGGNYKSSIDNPNYGVSPGGTYKDLKNNYLRLNYQPVQVLGLFVCF